MHLLGSPQCGTLDLVDSQGLASDSSPRPPLQGSDLEPLTSSLKAFPSALHSLGTVPQPPERVSGNYDPMVLLCQLSPASRDVWERLARVWIVEHSRGTCAARCGSAAP